MARLDQAFDPNSVPDDDVLPAGEYEVRITRSEINPTKAGTGQILMLMMRVESGPHQGYNHFERLNIVNPNATAQKIAGQTLAKIMKATGTPSPLTNSDELHHKPFIARFDQKTDDYGPKNNLKAARPIGGQPAQAPAQQGQPQQPAMAGAPATPDKPWA